MRNYLIATFIKCLKTFCKHFVKQSMTLRGKKITRYIAGGLGGQMRWYMPFNLSTRMAEAGRSMSLRPLWST